MSALTANDWHGNIEIDFNYPAPDWPSISEYDDPWYAYMDDNIALSSEHEQNSTNGAKET